MNAAASRRFPLPVVLAALGGVAAALLAFGPENFLVDDAYISFRYAANLAAGQGLVFNVGDRVEGYTNFLWVLALAGAKAMGLEIPNTARFLGFLCGLATLGVTFTLGRLLFRGRPALIQALPGLLLATNRSFWFWSVGGLETPLFCFLVILGITLHLRYRGPRDAVLSSLALFAAALTRPEGVMVFGLLMAHRLVSPSAGTTIDAKPPGGGAHRVSTRLRAVLLPSAVFAAHLVPYLVWKYQYFGSLLPNTFYAKSVGEPALVMPGLRYVRNFVVDYGFGLGLLGLAVPLVAAPRGVRRPAVGLLAAVALAYLLYVAGVGGDIYYHYRFLVPLFTLLYAALTAAALLLDDIVVVRFPRLPPGAVAVVVLLALNGSAVALSEARFRETMAREVRSDLFRERVAAWLVREFPPDTRIATVAVGIVPYLTGFPTIDLVGLVDREIGRSAVVGRGLGPLAHQKSSAESVLRRRPDFIEFGIQMGEIPEILAQRGWPIDFARSGGAFYLVQPIYPSRLELILNPDFHRAYRLMAYPVAGGYSVMTFRRFPPGAIPESEAMANLGWALWSVGSAAEGIALLQRAAAAAPEDARAAARLAVIMNRR